MTNEITVSFHSPPNCQISSNVEQKLLCSVFLKRKCDFVDFSQCIQQASTLTHTIIVGCHLIMNKSIPFSWTASHNSARDNKWSCIHWNPSVIFTVLFLQTYHLCSCTSDFAFFFFSIHHSWHLPWSEYGPETEPMLSPNEMWKISQFKCKKRVLAQWWWRAPRSA